MYFDTRTLLVAVALANAFSAGARVLLWRMHRGIPGLALWAWAAAAASFGLLLILAQASAPGGPWFALAQVLIVSGLVLVWDGFRRFVGRSPLPWRVIAAVAVAAVIALGIAHVQPSLSVRAFGNAVLVAALSALIARDLLSAVKPGQVALPATAWVYAANAAFFVVRAISIAQGAPGAAPWDPDGHAALSLLWWLCVTVATTLGMVLMTTERLQADLDRQASRDPLTGALNRRAFACIAEKEVARARRHGQPLSVLMMDLDNFKQINDCLGHGQGDLILCQFVASAERVLRGEDVFCRFGGEEFVAVLPDTSAEQALVAAERLRAVFAHDSAHAEDGIDSLPFDISVSVGIGELEADEDMDGVLRRADAALYRAKDLGRNRCEVAPAVGNRIAGVSRSQPVSEGGPSSQ